MKKHTIFLATAVSLIILMTAGTFALASDISEADYIGTVLVSNNGTAATGVSVIMSLDSQSLIDNFGVDTTFNYVAVRNDAGEDVPFTPSVNETIPWCFWVPSIGANSNLGDSLYIGHSDLEATKYYFPGETGMSITDAAALECSSNFSLEVDGYIDTEPIFPSVLSTSNSTEDSVVNSHDVTLPDDIESGDLLIMTFHAYTAAVVSCSLTFPAGWTSLAEYEALTYRCGGIAYRVADGTEGATVTVTTTQNMYSAHQVCRIQDYSGVPTISTIAQGTGATPDPALLAGTGARLWIAWFGAGTTGNYTMSDTPSGYSDENLVKTSAGYSYNGWAFREYCPISSEDPGSFTMSGTVLWMAYTVSVPGQPTTVNSLIKKDSAINSWVTGTQEITAAITGGATVTASGISAGEHKVRVYADSTNLTIEIDDVAEDTAALGGVPVPNTANAWQIGSYATPYIEYAAIEVGGTQQGYWEWEYDTTFTDQSEHGHHATPSFRTGSSDADVSANLTDFKPLTEAKAVYNPSLDWPSMVTEAPEQPDTMYTENATPGIFFAPLIHKFWPESGVPESFFWYNFTFAIILAAGILTFRIHPSLLLKTITMSTIMIMWALPGPNVYGMYVVIYFTMFSFGLLVLSKSYGW